MLDFPYTSPKFYQIKKNVIYTYKTRLLQEGCLNRKIISKYSSIRHILDILGRSIEYYI